MRDARWAKHRISVERWKLAHYQYYLSQKKRLAHRPEYLEHRRTMYAQKKSVRPYPQIKSLSTQEIIYDIEEANEIRDRSSHPQWSGTTGSTQRVGPDPALRTATQGVGQPGGHIDTSREALL
jgi:hypothetical protein